MTKERLIKPKVLSRTPKEQAEAFFTEINNQELVIQKILEQKGVYEPLIRQNIEDFVLYWTEPNKNGTKQRWELEKTFEVFRRLRTWFARSKTYKNPSRIIQI